MSRHELTSVPPERSTAGAPFPGPPWQGTGAGGRRAGPGEPRWLPDTQEACGAAETLLVTASEPLRLEVERIVAVTGRQLTCVAGVEEAAAYWAAAGAVLVGGDITELPYRRRAPAVVVGLSGDGDGLWRLAAAVGAERVAVLPEGGPWLAEYLSRSGSEEPGGHVLGVVGGCGGAGATTTAVWLAQEAARQGVRVLLVDGDPWGGGLELALAAEEEPGLRWPDLTDASGSIDPATLHSALPVIGGFSFLSWPGNRQPGPALGPAAAAVVLDAARRGYELVVVDTGRGREALRAFGWECDRLLVVLPAQLRAAVAAARLVPELPPVETSLVVRNRPGVAVDEQLLAECVGLPVAGVLPEIRGTAAATELGRLLETGNRRSVQRFAAAALAAASAAVP